MRKIIEIALKDNRIRFSSWTELLFFLVLPIAFTMFLGGQGQPNDGDSDRDTRIALPVVNEDGGALSADLLNRLAASDVVRPVEQTAAAAAEQFSLNETPAWLTIPTGFTDSLLAGEPVALALQRQPNNPQADAAVQAITVAADEVGRALSIAQASVQAAEAIRPFADTAERDNYFQNALTQARERLAVLPARVIVRQPDEATTQAGAFDLAAFAAAGQLVTWVFIPLLGTSGIFAYERVMGTLRRLITTPTSKATFLLGTVTGQLSAGILQMTALILFGALVIGINWGQSPAALALMVVTFGLAVVAMGVMLGTFVKTMSQASGLSIMLGMSMALLGGCWFPLETFPPAVQQAVHVLPTTWAMRGFTDIVIRGQGVQAVLLETAVLLAFALVFFAIAVWRFRFE